MTLFINFKIFLSLIVCAHWFKELEASRQVVLTCGSDEAGEKGAPGLQVLRALQENEAQLVFLDLLEKKV